MGVDVTNGIVPLAPPSHVRVPPAEYVVISLPDSWTYPIQWTKDGKPITGATNRTLALAPATTGDTGLYHVTGAPFPFATNGIALDVVPAGHLGNQSCKIELGPNGAVQIMGFVVGGRAPKSMLFRVIGPTLKSFGVTSPASRPTVTCFDGNGRQVGFAHVAIPVDLNALFQSVGAFPISTSELSTISFDYGPFQPGSYTLHVSDAAGIGGTALVEVYEMQP